jgi:hypothetical protein
MIARMLLKSWAMPPASPSPSLLRLHELLLEAFPFRVVEINVQLLQLALRSR